MKRLSIALAAALAAGAASAAMPLFQATCPTKLEVDSDDKGGVRINGAKATVKKLNENVFEARHAGVTVGITLAANGPPNIDYTGPKGANGICTVNTWAPAGGKPAAQPSAAARPSASERAGQGKFDATATIPCAQSPGQPMGRCSASVARESGGTAAVIVKRPDGRTRAIFFEKGKAVSADLSQADGNMRFRATKEADLFKVQAGDERYEIPEAFIFGG